MATGIGCLSSLPPQGPFRGLLGFLPTQRGLQCSLQPSFKLCPPGSNSVLTPVFPSRPGGCCMGHTPPYSRRLVVAWASGLKDRGPTEEGSHRGLSLCLELWVHCLVVCERPACVAGGGHPSLQPRPHPDPHEALAPAHLQLPLPPSLSCLSPVFQNPCPHPHLHLLPLPSPRTPAGLSGPCLTSSLPPLSSSLPLLPLQLPADRVRQVHPVLRAPGPPSTSNQIPSIPRRLLSKPAWTAVL